MRRNPNQSTLAFVALAFSAANVVGGYAVTDRMLQMFRRRPVATADQTGSESSAGFSTTAVSRLPSAASTKMSRVLPPPLGGAL